MQWNAAGIHEVECGPGGDYLGYLGMQGNVGHRILDVRERT